MRKGIGTIVAATVVCVLVGRQAVSAADGHLEALTADQRAQVQQAGPALAKGAASELYGTFTNTACNLTYDTPSGWSYSPLLNTSTAVWLLVESSSYRADVHIMSFVQDNVEEAEKAPAAGAFSSLEWCYERADGYAPYLYNIEDTTAGDIKFAIAKCKYRADHDSIRVCWKYSNGLSYHTVFFITNVTDYNANKDVYAQHFINAQFVSVAAASKAAAKTAASLPTVDARGKTVYVTSAVQRDLKVSLYSLLGRRSATLFEGSVAGTKAIPLSEEQARGFNVLMMKTRDGSSAQTIPIGD